MKRIMSLMMCVVSICLMSMSAFAVSVEESNNVCALSVSEKVAILQDEAIQSSYLLSDESIYKIETQCDYSVTVKSQSIYVAQNGRTYENGSKTQTKTYSRSTQEWLINLPASWKPVQSGVAGTGIGANYTFTMKRGQSTKYWSKTVSCPIENNPIPLGIG